MNRHVPVAEQQRTLAVKLRGHYQYYGITGNWSSLGLFFCEVERTWRKWLNRQSQRAQMSWIRFELLLQRYPLPGPIAAHLLQRRDAQPFSKSRMR